MAVNYRETAFHLPSGVNKDCIGIYYGSTNSSKKTLTNNEEWENGKFCGGKIFLLGGWKSDQE